MEQDGYIDESDFYPDEKRKVVDDIDAQLVLPHSNRAQGVDGQMKHQKGPDRNDAGERMNFKEKKMRLVFSNSSHLCQPGRRSLERKQENGEYRTFDKCCRAVQVPKTEKSVTLPRLRSGRKTSNPYLNIFTHLSF